MKGNNIANGLIGLSVLVATVATFLYVHQKKDIDVLSDNRTEKYQLLNSRLDSLSDEIDSLKEDIEYLKSDTIKPFKKIIRLKPVRQSQNQIKNINEPVCMLPLGPSLPSSEAVRGQALLDLIDSISYSAVKLTQAAPKQDKGTIDNPHINFANIGFGARLYNNSHTEVIQKNGKISIDSAKINGLAIMGKVAFTGNTPVNKPILQFVLTYIPKDKEIHVTSFSENLTSPSRSGSDFYCPIYLETNSYQKGLYRITVYYSGKIVSYQNLYLI